MLQKEHSSCLQTSPKCVSNPATAPLPDLAAGLSPLRRAVSGRPGRHLPERQDHLLGFSICSWEGGWQSKLQSRLGLQLPLGQDRPACAGEGLPGARPQRGSRARAVGATSAPGPARVAGKPALKAPRASLAAWEDQGQSPLSGASGMFFDLSDSVSSLCHVKTNAGP